MTPSEQDNIGILTSLVAIYKQSSHEPLRDKLDESDIAQVLFPRPPSVPCSSAGAKNYYERITYFNGDKVWELITRLNEWPAGGQLADIATLADAHKKIRAVRGALSDRLSLQLPYGLSDQMTADLDMRLDEIAVHAAKRALAYLGMYKGPIDDEEDDAFKRALATFQNSQALDPDGMLDPQTSQALRKAAPDAFKR